jgi:hypothetical protein
VIPTLFDTPSWYLIIARIDLFSRRMPTQRNRWRPFSLSDVVAAQMAVASKLVKNARLIEGRMANVEVIPSLFDTPSWYPILARPVLQARCLLPSVWLRLLRTGREIGGNRSPE